jgi:hypothetical protein
LRILYQPDESQVQVKHLDLGDITGRHTFEGELAEAAKTAPKSSELLDCWLAARLSGADNFNIRSIRMATRPIFA